MERERSRTERALGKSCILQGLTYVNNDIGHGAKNGVRVQRREALRSVRKGLRCGRLHPWRGCCGFRPAVAHDFRGDHFQCDDDARGQDEQIILIAQDRNEIRNQVDGAEGIATTRATTILARRGTRGSRRARLRALISVLSARARSFQKATQRSPDVILLLPSKGWGVDRRRSAVQDRLFVLRGRNYCGTLDKR